MELRDLNHEERLSLVTLLQEVVGADSSASEAEANAIDRVVQALGEDEYQRLVDEVDSRFTDEVGLKTFLASIGRQEARELIYGTVLETATADTVSTSESDVLDWLARTWNVRVEIADG
jgi:Tellurite resistance protein TerB